MTLENFLKSYGGNACLTIDGFCEEKHYDFETDFENGNVTEESWWNEAKGKKIKFWNIIGGDSGYPVELIIELED